MKIKAKLILGIGLLFVMIVLLTALSIVFINKLKGDTNNILVANYNTLNYSRNMMIALNNRELGSEEINLFETNLVKQQNNVTEPGEKELTDKLVSDFNKLKNSGGDGLLVKNIRTDITDIMLLNMKAIQHKSSVAKTTADNATLWITIAGTICFLISFTLLVNLPGNIAKPVRD